MADNLSKETRSFNMSRIRSKDTKPELLVRKFLFSQGFRYRLHSSRIPGSPDIVLSKQKVVVFVHGCFWHGHSGCRHSVMPKSNQDYWIPKIERTKVRDLNSSAVIRELGWDILIIWECELKPKVVDDTLIRLLTRLKPPGNAAGV
jgi:DNA mismatch endonuclease (patch repair protein)